ncbi:unnamed protein product [Candida verbasci]|uniref:Copper transport protein n=1 Tax=Candida verbasci TaxID=1227364 RepID=A0A9W4XG34_9ASCO|nr:unnamed protein product [Candida verbasci]
MDHSSHLQGGMNHGDHSMPDMPHDMCSMNMLFTWDWKNSCIVFKWWHVKTFQQFVLSFFLIVIFSSLYEFIKNWILTWEYKQSNNLLGSSSSSITNQSTVKVNERRFKIKKSLLYGLQVFYSFLLMLVFMTYNGWYMIAVALGASLGHYIWGGVNNDSSIRNMSCH